MGAVLPLAGPAMYGNLGANWAASLCGFLLLLIAPTPFIFYKYGSRFRRRSTLIKEMRAELERLEGKRSRRPTPTPGDLERGLKEMEAQKKRLGEESKPQEETEAVN